MYSLYFLQFCLFLYVSFSTAKTLPTRTLGIYCLLADDGEVGYTSSDNWQPSLYNYQTQGSNVLFFAFINPKNMSVPPAFSNLAKCKGKTGCPSSSQLVIFSIGGAGYSENSWPWLASAAKAQAMAVQVATWPSMYGCDGIDIDIEGIAGSSNTTGTNLIIFAKKLKSLNSGIIITIPVYGYPQIQAEINIVNAAWTTSGQSNGVINSIGLMVYQDTGSLQYVQDYAYATSEWQGFPITVNVPKPNILCGIQGTAASATITQMATDIVNENLGVIMVWYASVYDKTRCKSAFTYGSDDATTLQSTTGQYWIQALQSMTT